MEDMLSKSKAQQNKLEQLVGKLPIYKGYKEKELRRETDKLLRDHLADLLKTEWERVADLQRQLLSGGMLIYVDDLQAAETRVRRFMDRVRNASYGYAGLFNMTKVDEATLDAIYEFDTSLLHNVEAIRGWLDSVQEAIDSGEGVPGAIRQAVEIIGIANKTFNDRDKIMRGIQ